MVVNQLAGVVNRSTLASEIKMLTIMKMAEPAEAEVVEGVAALRTKVVIVLNQRAASNAERKVTFQENVLILAEEALQEEVVASSAARTVTWLVIVQVMRQEEITILRVVVVVEEELQVEARFLSVIASNARKRVISREIALTIMVTEMLSPTRDRGEMKMVALTAEEVATTTMHLPLATVSGETILHLPRTLVHSGEHLTTITPMPKLTPGEILTPATTTTRHQLMHGAPPTTMMAAAVAGTEY